MLDLKTDVDMNATSSQQATSESPAEADAESRQLYTPAMLAELLGIPVRTIRRWHRAGLVEPVIETMQVPHFDFAGLSTARQLAEWMRQGASVSSIQLQLEAHRARVGRAARIEDLPITAEGRKLVLRHGDQFVESTGQFRFGFDNDSFDEMPSNATLPFELPQRDERAANPVRQLLADDMSLQAIVDQAITAEDEADFDTAIRWYRCALTAHGPSADICFQLAELLYRVGDLGGARERYFNALEIDPDLVEARANLGCVLLECGQIDLAIASFEGALQQFPDYADVHFHFARALDDHGESGRAAEHWQKFLMLAPSSPWADEAKARLQEHIPLEFSDETV